MSPLVQLLSVNVGALERAAPGSSKRTGIFKHPVGGAVLCDRMGLVGDRIGNTKHHGGADQAVYLYSAEDYAWWSEALGRECAPGLFGENCTLDRWWPDYKVGDQITFGDVTLELSAPRIPCATLAGRIGDPHFVKRFMQANRGGAYARVLATGALSRGMAGTVQAASEPWPTISALFALWYERPLDAAARQALQGAPLAERARLAFAS